MEILISLSGGIAFGWLASSAYCSYQHSQYLKKMHADVWVEDLKQKWATASDIR